MAEHTDDPAGINPPNGQRHGLFRALPPLSIPRALRRTQTCSAQIAGGMPVSDAGTARDVRDQCNDPIRSTNKSVNTTHTTLRSPGADELLARPGILPDATPPEASLVRRPMTDTSTRHDGAKFGMDEAAAASVKSAVLSRPNADDAMATNPFTAIPKVQSVPESHPPTPVLRFNEEDGTIRKIKNIGNKLAAPFAPSGNTASLSPPPVTQGAKLKSPEGKSKNSAKDADAQHWSRLSRKEREILRNQVVSDMSAFSWTSAPAAPMPKLFRARSVSPKRVEATRMDFAYMAAQQKSTRQKQSMTSCSSSHLSSPSEQAPSPLATSSTFEDTSDEESAVESQTSDDEDAGVDAPIDSARQSTKYSSKGTSVHPIRSRGESIGLPDCSQDAMVRAAMFEKKLSSRPSGTCTGYKEAGKARVDLMSRTSTVTGFQLCDVRKSADVDERGSSKRIVRVRGETL